MKLNPLILNESSTTSLDKEEWMKLVRTDCSEYLKSNPKTPLFRGLPYDKDFVVGKIRNNRVPRDTSKELNILLNKFYKEKVGIDNIRAKSAFFTPDPEEAVKYGIVYVVFPTDSSIVVDSGFVDAANIVDNFVDDFRWQPFIEKYIVKHFDNLSQEKFGEIFTAYLDGLDIVSLYLNGPTSKYVDYMAKYTGLPNNVLELSFKELINEFASNLDWKPPKKIKIRKLDRHVVGNNNEFMILGEKYYAVSARRAGLFFHPKYFRKLIKELREG